MKSSDFMMTDQFSLRNNANCEVRHLLRICIGPSVAYGPKETFTDVVHQANDFKASEKEWALNGLIQESISRMV